MSNYTNNEILHVKKGNIEYLQFKRLLEYEDKLTHCFTLRHGGVSKGVLASLNFRMTSKDSKENLKENLIRICKAININENEVVRNLQVHGNKIEIIDKNNINDYLFYKYNMTGKNDGFIVATPNITTLTTSADCNLLLIYDPVNNVIANIHSGWKGTVKQIYLNGINMLKQKFNSNPEDLICCIGPSILKCCWKSRDTEGVKKQITAVWENEEDYIEFKKDGYYYVDFHYVIIKDLLKAGLKQENIIDSNICTCCNNQDFFSYRQTTMKKEEDFGTMCMLAKLK